eukprot:766894-Hanusia_phi.AAC.2
MQGRVPGGHTGVRNDQGRVFYRTDTGSKRVPGVDGVQGAEGQENSSICWRVQWREQSGIARQKQDADERGETRRGY